MANIKSQIKRNRQNNKRRLRNRVYRGTARIAVKGARTAMEDRTPESKASLVNAISMLDKAVERGVLHKNNAARRKSRLMKAYNAMGPVMAEPVNEATVVEPVAEAAPKKAAPRRRAVKAEPEAKSEAEAPKAPAKKAASTSTRAKKTSSTRKAAASKAD